MVRKAGADHRRLCAYLKGLTIVVLTTILYCGYVSVGIAQSRASSAVLRPLAASNYETHQVCQPPAAGHEGCLAKLLVPASSAARAHNTPIGGAARDTGGAPGSARGGYFGLTPADLHSAYDLPTTPPGSQTIAVIDAYDDPTVEADLKVYDEEFGLPECSSANGCFTKLNEAGQPGPLPEGETGWGVEISLDVETAHAVCQSCHVLLIEADSSYLSDLEAAVKTAVEQGATEVSNSYGGGDSPELGGYNYPGVVITASSGDWGFQEPASYPASSPNVVAVGGTTLDVEEGWKSESAWSAGGSGCSAFSTAPRWQQSVEDWAQVGCGTARASADVSAVADPETGVAIYDSSYASEGSGWLTVGGTSLSSPLVAASFALAGGAQWVSYPAETLYAHRGSAGLHDVTEGSNGFCSGTLVCDAGVGYDGPTGVGTPNGLSAFVPEPIQQRPRVNSISPATGSTAGGDWVTITGTNLSGAEGVELGGAPASIVSNSGTTIVVSTPAHVAGTVDTTVMGEAGQSSPVTAADLFTYVAAVPSVTSLSPADGSARGGAIVTISGASLGEVETVQFGGKSAEILSRGSGSLTVRSPAHSAGIVPVIASSAYGSSADTPADRFNYAASGPGLTNVRILPGDFRHGRDPRLRFTLTERATVTVAGARIVRGHKEGARCIWPAKRKSGCSVAVRATTTRLDGERGNNLLRLPFAHLRPGHYEATVQAQSPQGRSEPAALVFTVTA